MQNTRPVIYAAPLQSYTTVFYRRAHHDVFGNVDKYFTPFFEQNKKGNFSPKLLPELEPALNQGINVVPQVLTDNTDFLMRFANAATEMGYADINLNLGCPHPPVWRKGLGSGLLLQPEKLDGLLSEYHKTSGVPTLSVKMRLGVYQNDEWRQILPILNSYPLTEIIVHPRTAKQLYKGTPDWDEFEQLIGQTHLPLVGNGDIDSLETYAHLQQRFPTVTRWMLGRGMLRNPWLPGLVQEKTGLTLGNMTEIKAFYQKFYNLVTEKTDDINIKRNLLHDFWHFPCEQIESGIKWRRSLAKKTSLSSYPQMVGELLQKSWLPNIGKPEE